MIGYKYSERHDLTDIQIFHNSSDDLNKFVQVNRTQMTRILQIFTDFICICVDPF